MLKKLNNKFNQNSFDILRNVTCGVAASRQISETSSLGLCIHITLFIHKYIKYKTQYNGKSGTNFINLVSFTSLERKVIYLITRVRTRQFAVILLHVCR
jgi:hypothetical protein